MQVDRLLVRADIDVDRILGNLEVKDDERGLGGIVRSVGIIDRSSNLRRELS